MNRLTSFLRSQLEETKKKAQGAEKVTEALALIEGQVDDEKKERNTITSQLEEKDEEIFKLKSDINFRNVKTCDATWMKEEK